jgi:hypothetical protein
MQGTAEKEELSNEKFECENQSRVNTTYVGYIQTTIGRMGQNSFQCKTWCITVTSALIVLAINQTDLSTRKMCIEIAVCVAILFALLDTYYLYLERGYRKLYNIVVNVETASIKICEYDMKIPNVARGCRAYIKAIVSVSTGLFYSAIVVGLYVIFCVGLK